MSTVTAAKPAPTAADAPTNAAAVQEIDGFQLVIEALKLNGIDTIFGLPGIPGHVDRDAQQPAGRAINLHQVVAQPGHGLFDYLLQRHVKFGFFRQKMRG